MEVQISDIRKIGSARRNASRKECPRDRLKSNASFLLEALTGHEEDRNAQCAEQRREREIRTGRQEQSAQLTQKIGKIERQVQPCLPRCSATEVLISQQ